MPTRTRLTNGAAQPRIVSHLLACAILVGSAYSQAPKDQSQKLAYPADKANLPDAIASVKSGDFGLVHVEMIASFGAVEAIPILKKQFESKDDPLTRAKLASALVRLGDKEGPHWDFLVGLATASVNNDAPSFWDFDEKGKVLPGPSARFVAWAQAKGIPLDVAGEDAMYKLPGPVAMLGETGDPRAIPLLRRALLSRNFMIENEAALGLAEAKDKGSIPLIIQACERAPSDWAAEIGKSLVYFDDTDAQRAVDRYVPADVANVYRDARANGKTPFR